MTTAMTRAEELRARLADATRSGLIGIDAVELDELRAAAAQLGFATLAIDLRGADRAAMYERFAQACGFPAWFGRNWDALLDSLSDWSWGASMPGYVLLVTGIEQAALGPDEVQTLAEILDEATRRMGHHGTPMWAILVEGQSPVHP